MSQTSHYLKKKNKKVIGLIKNELRGKVKTEIKMYSYLVENSDENDKEKRTKKCVIISVLISGLISPTYMLHMF